MHRRKDVKGVQVQPQITRLHDPVDMHTCIYVGTYTCRHRRRHARGALGMCAITHWDEHLHREIHTCIHTPVQTHIHTCIHTPANTCTHLHNPTYTPLYKRTHIHTSLHTHTHTHPTHTRTYTPLHTRMMHKLPLEPSSPMVRYRWLVSRSPRQP